jgi:hypothetical protein
MTHIIIKCIWAAAMKVSKDFKVDRSRADVFPRLAPPAQHFFSDASVLKDEQRDHY